MIKQKLTYALGYIIIVVAIAAPAIALGILLGWKEVLIDLTILGAFLGIAVLITLGWILIEKAERMNKK